MKTLIIAATALFAAAAPALAAQPQAALPAISVSYADLDLHAAKDAAVMLKRIQRASATACTEGSSFVGNDAETVRRIDACYRQSVARAVAGLSAPLVTQAYAGTSAGARLAAR